MKHSLVLRVSGLEKSFTLHNQGGISLNVLKNVSFEVNAGECVVLNGPSGSGKSTILKCIFANYLASSGAIHVLHHNEWLDVTSAPSHALLQMRASTIGYVSQFLRVVPRVPAIDVIAEAHADHASEEEVIRDSARRRAEALLNRLRIPPRLWHVPPSTFSGGEQQRINIARSFIQPRPIMLLDEPTASLDAENRNTVVDLIQESLAAGCAVVGIFHDRAVREAVADRTIEIASES